MILTNSIYSSLKISSEKGQKKLAVLIDPEKFDLERTDAFFRNLHPHVSLFLVGGSTTLKLNTEPVVKAIKNYTDLPVIIFPGDHSQITEAADAILFLSLISGRNPEYLIGQQVKAVQTLKDLKLEIIPTGYILIDGGKECAVHRVSNTPPIAQKEIKTIVETALAGQYSGKKLIYLEAGSGATIPVSGEIITAVKMAIKIPLIVGGGICSKKQLFAAYAAGADIVVVGTAFENDIEF